MSKENNSRKLILLPDGAGIDGDIEVFEFPSPSNNSSKVPLKLFIYGDQVYQLQDYTFSKGSRYNETEDLATEKYHYTNDGKPVKSMFLIDESDRSKAFIIEDSYFQVSTKYDIGFSLIACHFKNSMSENEEEYTMKRNNNSNDIPDEKKVDDRFLTLRDYHDILIDSHHENWRRIPQNILQLSLEKVSQSIEEAGDKYYKMTAGTITSWLYEKIEKIVSNFPQSLPISLDLPEDIKLSLKFIMACNLLISLLPLSAYKELTSLNSIKEHFVKYNAYMKENADLIEQRELLTQSAMSVGLGDGSNSNKNDKKIIKPIRKPAIAKKKVTVGKGAIDGFFKRQSKK